jgi:hypothetical protein
MLERHADRLLDPLARASAGMSRLARIAMIAITTSSSISVKARVRCRTPKHECEHAFVLTCKMSLDDMDLILMFSFQYVA